MGFAGKHSKVTGLSKKEDFFQREIGMHLSLFRSNLNQYWERTLGGFLLWDKNLLSSGRREDWKGKPLGMNCGSFLHLILFRRDIGQRKHVHLD